MVKVFRFAVVLLGLSIGILMAHAQTAGAELNLGIAAYKQGKYDEAVMHFKKCVALDPDRSVPHLYLAVAYAQQYIPGADIPDNNQLGQSAIQEFQTVLALNPNRDQETSSLKGIASLYFNMKQFEKAKEYYKKVLVIDPDDAENYYAIGVIDWTEAYQPRMEARAKLSLKPDEALINMSECWEVRAKSEDRVNDGIEMLTKALSLRKDYDDAMAYMNLMYRERADIQCGDMQAYDTDVREADKWVDMTMATKKAKTEPAPSKSRE